MSDADTLSRARIVEGEMNYAIDDGSFPRFHARDRSLDTVHTDPRTVPIVDGRSLADPPRLDREGFALVQMPTSVADFRDTAQVEALYSGEVETFIRALTGADAVAISGPAALRFGARSDASDRALHSKTAHLIHSDTWQTASEDFTRQSNPHPERVLQRTVHHNIWRTFSPPPQDVPLALCDFRSVAVEDMIKAEAAFDDDQGQVHWTFDAMLFRYNPEHRWHFWSNLDRDEALVFVRYDSDRSRPWFVPHSAFDDPTAPADAVPRASIEIRTISYWYE